MASEHQKVIATAALVSVSVGSANAVLKYKRPPSYRFLIGSGMAFLLLSALGNSEALGEVAKGLALGIMTTILLGEGGGVMSYFAGEAEVNTAKRRILDDVEPADPDQRRRVHQRLTVNPQGGFRSDFLPPFPGVPPTTNR